MIRDEFRVKESMYATKGQRFGNFIIDRIILLVLVYAGGYLLGMLLAATDNIEMLYQIQTINPVTDYLVSGVIFAIYYIILEGTTQKSIGKFITKTIVVDEFGNKPSMGAIIGRSFCRMIPFNHFSFLGETGRGWHDSIPNTYVVEIHRLEKQKKLHENLNDLGKEESEFLNL